MSLTVDNRTADFPQLLRDQGEWIAQNGTCFCPFHEDEQHRSAKFFHDGDGWRLYCWVCGRQFRPSDFYRKMKKDGLITDSLVIIGEEDDDGYEAMDTEFLSGFKNGAMDINQFCRTVFEKKRERKNVGETGVG